MKKGGSCSLKAHQLEREKKKNQPKKKAERRIELKDRKRSRRERFAEVASVRKEEGQDFQVAILRKIRSFARELLQVLVVPKMVSSRESESLGRQALSGGKLNIPALRNFCASFFPPVFNGNFFSTTLLFAAFSLLKFSSPVKQ